MSRRGRPHERSIRVVLCAALTLDGRLASDPPVVPAVLYSSSGGTDRHPWAGLFDSAAAILVDDEVAATLPDATGGSPGSIAVARQALGGAGDWLRPVREALLPKERPDRPGQVLCFGGAALFRAVLDAGLASEIAVMISSRVNGRPGAGTLSGPAGTGFFPASISCRLLTVEQRDDQCCLRYRVRPSRQIARAAQT